MLLTICLLLVVTTSVALTLIAHGAVHWLSLQQGRPKRGTAPVSILKPLKGLDDDLQANLESFCNQDHPAYEIIFGAADGADPALKVARKVARSHPGLPIRIVVGDWSTGLNPKVRLLRSMVRCARYDNILISDSNVRAGVGYLSATSAELQDPKVGLVSNPIVGSGGGTFGSSVENLQLNSYAPHGIVLANFVGKHACVMGKSMLLRRRALAAAGGFEKFADVLAEDYLIGRAVARAGWKVVTSPIAIESVSNTGSLKTAWQRHLRWAQIRRSLGIAGYFFELVLSPNVWLALAVVVAYSSPLVRAMGCQTAALLGCAIAYVLMCLSEAIAVRQWSGDSSSIVAGVLLASLRQYLQLSWWLFAFFTNDVNWRGNKLRIGKGSKLSVPRRTLAPAVQRLFRQVA